MRRAELTALRRMRGARGRRDGRTAEWIAAAWLMFTGWRVLAMRLKTPGAEIDLLARRGEVLAVVEVKRRGTLAQASEALRHDQARRLRRAGETYAARRPELAHLGVRVDLLALAPGRLPRRIEGIDA